MVVPRISKIFVTGGTGFVGQEFVRNSLRTGKDIVLLTRNPQRVPKGLRINVVHGDLGNVPSFKGYLKGCDAIVHCAKADDADPAKRGQIDLEGTQNLMDAAICAHVRRFLHISTVSVYGIPDRGLIDEGSPRKPTNDQYTQSKIQIEREVLRRKPNVDVVILQPANIYGPGRCWWSHSLLNMMRRGKVIMVNDGHGLANMVHVADVVQAMQLALCADGIQGECFIISGGQPVFWKEYFRGLEQIVGHDATVSLAAPDARELSRKLMSRSLTVRAQRWFGRALLKKPIIFPLSDECVDNYACETEFSIAKATKHLDYRPRYDILAGLKTVREYEETV